MARQVDQLTQEEGGQARGGSVFPPKMRLHDRQREADRLVGFTTNYNTPHPHCMGGTTHALQCSAVQFSSHPMTGHVAATCDLPQPASPTPHGWTSRRAPEGPSPLQRGWRSRGGGGPDRVCCFFYCFVRSLFLLSLAVMGRRSRWDTPTMTASPSGGRKWVYL